MDGFLLALLLAFALATGGRDQAMVAEWADALGRSRPLLITAILVSVASAAAMVWIGAQFAALLPPRASRMLVAFALAFAALELAIPLRHKTPREPTRSLGAIAIVLLARQIGDAARFGIMALATWAAMPLAAGLGGAIGGSAAVALGWATGHAGLARLPLRAIRLTLAVAAAIAALFIGLSARFTAL